MVFVTSGVSIRVIVICLEEPSGKIQFKNFFPLFHLCLSQVSGRGNVFLLLNCYSGVSLKETTRGIFEWWGWGYQGANDPNWIDASFAFRIQLRVQVWGVVSASAAIPLVSEGRYGRTASRRLSNARVPSRAPVCLAERAPSSPLSPAVLVDLALAR